ncbi:MAG: S8 family peptidase [Pseudonocardiaceae bacterium]
MASVGVSGPASAQSGALGLAVGLVPAAGLPPTPLQGKINPRLGATRGPVTVFVELVQTPAVEVFHAERSAGRSAPVAARAAGAAKSQTGQAADRVLGLLRHRSADVHELFRTTNAVAGLAVIADTATLGELAGSPDVRSVRTIVPKTAMNASAVALTRTLRAWQQTGWLGDGVRIGIIDDGIDYTHADFGGPGTRSAYTAIDRTVVKASYFPTGKVVGGYDFAGDDYDGGVTAGPLGIIPRPDPNPLSCGEHGNHVAGTAAGFGVNGDGSTFRGDYRNLDPAALNALRIGPGTAPRAQLYALKVFGCHGATGLVAKAMDWALDPDGDGDFSDRLDVVNLSLGTDYGAPDDPDSLFVRKLALNGVLPVFAAGNGGDLYDVGGAPGNTPEALTVASSRDSAVLRDGAQVTAPSDETATVRGQILAGQYSQEFSGYDSLDRTAPVVRLSDPANADGCQPYSGADAAAVAGKHVWLEWDDDNATRRCGSKVRADHALAAKAAAVLLSSAIEQFAAGIAGNAGVPMFQFTGPGTATLRPAVAAGTLRVRLAGKLRSSVHTDDPRITDTPSEFSSRDVRGPALKPDVAAPGDTIASALTGSGSGVLVISGTSMASPHVAGIGALVRQAHPDWSVAEVKAAVVNTAGADVYSRDGQQGPIAAPNRVGAGRVDAAAAVGNQVLAMVPDDPGQVSANFGVVEAAGPVTLNKTITLVNKGATAARYTVAYQPVNTMPGVRYQLSSRSVDIAARGVAALTVTLRIDDPSALRRTADPTIEKTQLGAARQFVADASGRVVLTPQAASGPDAPPLRVPVYAAPRPVADMAAPQSLRFLGHDRQAVLALSGQGVDQGSGDAAYRSLISVLQLQAESGRLHTCEGVFVAYCTPNGTAQGGDIRYVGVTSTAPLAVARGRPGDALLAFGITTWEDWYNVGSNTIPFVDIDTSGDGLPDFEVRGTKLAGTDVLVAVTVDLHTPPDSPPVQVLPVNGQYGDVDSGVFDSNVIVLPVSLAALGIDPLAVTAPISYTTGVASYYTGPVNIGEVIDSTGPALFDAVRPGLWTQGVGDPALSYLARPGTVLIVNRDTAAAVAQRATQLLVLHPGNPSRHRVQLVGVSAPGSGPVSGPAVPLPVPAAPPIPVAPADRARSAARPAGP